MTLISTKIQFNILLHTQSMVCATADSLLCNQCLECLGYITLRGVCTKQRVLGITSQSSCCGHSLGKMFSVFLVSRNDAVRWIHSVR